MPTFTFYTKESDCATHQERTTVSTDEATYIRHGVASALCKNAGVPTGFDPAGFSNWVKALDAAQHLLRRGATHQETRS